MELSATRLRQNLYSILDKALESGETIIVKRSGRCLRIIPEMTQSKFSRLKRRRITSGNGSDLSDIHWDKEWSGKDDNDFS